MRPTKCYAVSSGEYGDYEVHAIYRRREDAETRMRTTNEVPRWLLDGKPVYGHVGDLSWEDRRRIEANPNRGFDLRVEEFDYYEGEPLPAPIEGDEIPVDYWKVAAALCRGLNEVRKDHGDRVADSVLNLLTIGLERVYPNLDWDNVMTDSWPLRREQR